MKIPSEAELIEMERKFDWILERSQILEDNADESRRDGRFADAEEFEAESEECEDRHRDVIALIALVRELKSGDGALLCPLETFPLPILNGLPT